MRREIPWGIAIIVCILILFNYFFNIPSIAAADSEIRSWITVLISFGTILGTISTLRSHVRHVQRRTEGRWFFSAWFVFYLLVTIVLGQAVGTFHPAYRFIYLNTLLPLFAATYGLAVCFTLTVAWRGFTIRNSGMLVMLIATFFLFMSYAPLYNIAWPASQKVGDFILLVMNKAGYRGLLMATSMGGLAIALRVLLGRERPFKKGE
jgi:hypothetical protein